MISRTSARTRIACLALFVSGSMAMGQCATPSWRPGQGEPGTDLYTTCSIMWDPDASGPLSPRLVIGGGFNVAGNVVTRGIAMLDLATGQWSDLAGGVSGGENGTATVYALAVLPNGHLVAGGAFTQAGTTPVNNLAEFNGSTWAPLGDGVQGAVAIETSVHALAVLQNGDLAAGGDFLVAGSVVANNIARWNGTTWLAYGSGIGVGDGLTPVQALAVLNNGHLVAGGDFLSAGGNLRNHIARWNGANWQDLAGGTDLMVQGLAVAPNGNLYSTGMFTTAGGSPASRIARWNSTTGSGNSWSALGPGLGGFSDEFYGNAITVLSNGEVVVAGNSYTRDHVAPFGNGVARWNGSVWSTLGAGLCDASNNGVFGRTVLSLPTGEIFVGGQFNRAGSAAAANIAKWNGTQWSGIASGFNDFLVGMRVLPGGDVLACGAFSIVDSIATSAIARWNGSSWSAVGAPGLLGFVSDAVVLTNGNILAAGQFVLPGQDPAVDNYSGLAVWNGAVWSNAGMENDGRVYSLVTMSNGDVVAAGAFTTTGGVATPDVAIWNGTVWSSLGAGVGDASIGEEALSACVLPSGELIVGGYLGSVGNLVVWNGTLWAPFAGGTDDAVFSTAAGPNGELVVAGAFTSVGGVPANKVARHDGTTWSALASGVDIGIPYATAVKSNGDIFIGGEFTLVGGVSASNIARWNGSEWSPLGAGISEGDGNSSVVVSIAMRPSGELLAGGRFFKAGGATSVNFARYGCDGCAADFNSDGIVDFFDYLDFVDAFSSGGPGADFNSDGEIDFFDYLDFVDAFSTGC